MEMRIPVIGHESGAAGTLIRGRGCVHIVPPSSMSLRWPRPVPGPWSGSRWPPSPSSSIAVRRDGHSLVMEFDAGVPVERASTPPSSWYIDPDFFSLELQTVFAGGWHVVGHTSELENPHDYFTGSLARAQYVISKNQNGELNAFHNVCRHHAAPLASGSGSKCSFVCPYHGWTYGLDGRLLKATRLSGIQNFSSLENSLWPIQVATWGPFILINLENDNCRGKIKHHRVGEEWLGDALEVVSTSGINDCLHHVARRKYIINCNWKVYCDNYLDGGYHVPFAHGGLAAGIQLQSYSTKIFEKVSLQTCETDGSDRLGKKAIYAFVYPNFMINRYGPWMDTNLVLPITESQCMVIFDYFLDPSLMGDQSFIQRSLEDSETVQMEDIRLCEGVQRGLESPAFDRGRYAPHVEVAMHHFHCLLRKNLIVEEEESLPLFSKSTHHQNSPTKVVTRTLPST